jgi:Protein of unknown function (DUF3102)
MSTLALAPPIVAVLDEPEDLAGRITHHHEQASLSIRDALTHAIAAGELLHEAKAHIDHGAWGDWLTENCDHLSDRTARQYMQLAEAQRETPQVLESLQEPTLTAALKAIAKPRPVTKTANPDRTQAKIVHLDPTVETHILTIHQLGDLVASFGGTTTETRIRRWIERLAEPKIAHCPDCNQTVLHAIVKGETVLADQYAWQPITRCTKCIQTRNAHPGVHVSCPHCQSTGWTGTKDRPTGRMLAMDIAWSDTPNVRIIGERTDRREGEALHPLHQCAAQEQAT